MHGPRREILIGLSPAEYWAYDYLRYLAHQQGSSCVTLPRPGEDPEIEKFSRKHLKRLLKALKAKRHLTHLLFPRSKSQQIQIVLPASILGTPMSPISAQGCTDVPNNGVRGAQMSPIITLGTPMSPIKEIISTAWPEMAHSQAKLKSYIQERLVKAKQGGLRGEIEELSAREVKLLRQRLGQILGTEPKGRSVSDRAKAYAMLRFLQGAGEIDKPQPWLDNVARQTEREWKKR